MTTSKHHSGHTHQLAYGLVVCACIVAAVFVVRSMSAVAVSDNEKSTSGIAIDSLHGIYVYQNGPVEHVEGMHISPEGYPYGLKWQCVEFVKRYYAQRFDHYMPVTKGHAKDFFNTALPDASFNEERDLVQYRNPSLKKPAVDDILVFEGTFSNRYGHIAIISGVFDDHIEIIQQNAGPGAPARELIGMEFEDGHWRILNRRVMGWMRIE